MKVIMNNTKTVRSIDVDTVCPYKELNKECEYCYVKSKRNTNSFMAKGIYDDIEYNDDILRMKQKTIDKLNGLGGIRMFSFSDYKRSKKDKIKKILDDCLFVGLDVKVITKQEDFITDFVEHKAIKRINVSIDSLENSNGFEPVRAIELRKKYSKVFIRNVILKDSDVDLLDFSDIFTFNHETNKFKKYTHSNMVAIAKRKGILKKVCCLTGKCETCNLKCGVI